MEPINENKDPMAGGDLESEGIEIFTQPKLRIRRKLE